MKYNVYEFHVYDDDKQCNEQRKQWSEMLEWLPRHTHQWKALTPIKT